LRLSESADNIDAVAAIADDIANVSNNMPAVIAAPGAADAAHTSEVNAAEHEDNAEAARDDAVAAKEAAEAAADSVNLPPIAANTMLVDNAVGTARETQPFAEVWERLSGSLVPYTGVVATGCKILSNVNTDNKQMMSRTRHFARAHIRSLNLLYANWYVDGTSLAEINAGGVREITATVEYPVGVFTRVKFGGSDSGIVAAGANLISDAVSVYIPRGAEFWIRTYAVGSDDIIYRGQLDQLAGEACAYGAAGIDDLTNGGVITSNNGTSNAYGPTAIIGQTTFPTIFNIGDSRDYGLHDTLNALSNAGTFERALSPYFGFISAARSADKASSFVSSHDKRMALAGYCSHAIVHHGINDLSNGATAAQLITDIEAIIGYFSIPVFTATLEPHTDTTDNWATLENQTPRSTNANRVTFNDAVRAGLTGAAGYFDIADAVESGRNSGLWKANGNAKAYTDDGTHATRFGYQIIQDSDVVAPNPLSATAIRVASPESATAGEASDEVVTPASLAGRAAFSANLGGADKTGIPATTLTRINFSNLVFDRGGYFNPTTFMWKPPKGVYFISGTLTFTSGITGGVPTVYILKNSATQLSSRAQTPGSSATAVTVSGVLEANGFDTFSIATIMPGTGVVSGSASKLVLLRVCDLGVKKFDEPSLGSRDG
jgi:hypothetical protein